MTHTYTVIQDWMLDLGLSTGELLAYAVIFGFSQDGETEFTGSRNYLARKMNAASKRTVDSALQSLSGRGLIVKTERTLNGIRYCTYRAVVPAETCTGGAENAPVENCTGGANSAPGGGANSAPKNKDNKIKIYPSLIAREMGIGWVEAETWEVLETLCAEPKWKKKTENALRLSLKKLAAVPEVEAAEMMRKAIANGWQGVFELHDDEKARLYHQNPVFGAHPYQNGTTPRPMPKSGVMASEALVQAAMEQFNS